MEELLKKLSDLKLHLEGTAESLHRKQATNLIDHINYCLQQSEQLLMPAALINAVQQSVNQAFSNRNSLPNVLVNLTN